jgi:hypothetical protein
MRPLTPSRSFCCCPPARRATEPGAQTHGSDSSIRSETRTSLPGPPDGIVHDKRLGNPLCLTPAARAQHSKLERTPGVRQALRPPRLRRRVALVLGCKRGQDKSVPADGVQPEAPKKWRQAGLGEDSLSGVALMPKGKTRNLLAIVVRRCLGLSPHTNVLKRVRVLDRIHDVTRRVLAVSSSPVHHQDDPRPHHHQQRAATTHRKRTKAPVAVSAAPCVLPGVRRGSRRRGS